MPEQRDIRTLESQRVIREMAGLLSTFGHHAQGHPEECIPEAEALYDSFFAIALDAARAQCPDNIAGKWCQHLDIRDGWCAHCGTDVPDLAQKIEYARQAGAREERAVAIEIADEEGRDCGCSARIMARLRARTTEPGDAPEGT